MVTVRVHEGEIVVDLTGTFTEEDENFLVLKAVNVRTSGGDAELSLARHIKRVPVELLVPVQDVDNTFRLPALKVAVEKGLAAAYARLRQALADLSIEGSSFFGFPNGFLAARVSIRLPEDLTGDKRGFLMEARARLEIKAEFKLPGYAEITTDARIDARISVTVDNVFATLEMLVPTLPNLGFTLRDVRMPSLDFSDFNGANINSGDLTALRLPLPDWLNDVAFVGGEPFTLKVNDQGAFTLSAGNPISISYIENESEAEIAKVADFEVFISSDRATINGTVTAADEVEIKKTFEFGGGKLPLRGRITVERVKAELNASSEFVLTWKISRIAIEATNDPKTRVAAAIDLITTINTTNGHTKWEVNSFRLLEIGADVTIDPPELNATIGGLLNFRVRFTANTAQALAELIDRLARLLAAVIYYMSSAVGAVTGLLSEVAGALAKLLAEGINELLKTLNDAGDYVIIELRLDAATLSPRQLVLIPRKLTVPPPEMKVGGGLLHIQADAALKPAFIFDFVHNWQGLALLRKDETNPKVTVSTNLWLASDKKEAGSIPTTDKKEPDSSPTGDETDPLISVGAAVKCHAIVVAALQHGRGRFFQTFDVPPEPADDVPPEPADPPGSAIPTLVGEIGNLRALMEQDADFELDAKKLEKTITALMPQGPESAGDELGKVKQYVVIDSFEHVQDTATSFKGTLNLRIKLESLEIKFALQMTLDIETLHFQLDEEDVIVVRGERQELSAFGFKLLIEPKSDTDDTDKFDLFKIKLADGDIRVELAKDSAVARLIYDRLSSDGSELQLRAKTFAIDRGGLDLTAEIDRDKPVRLGGLNQPFRFNSGSISIRGSKLVGGTISGFGPMPPALIGEANAEIDLVFGPRGNHLALVAANAKLEKEGEPLYSTGTRFRVVIDALGLGFKDAEVGPVQFYFQLWGSASFEPQVGEFNSGLLENLKSVAIKLDGAPLTSDGRELIKYISFLVELDPPMQESLFEIFKFEIRGIGFYPASQAWPDTPPAVGIAGQIAFLEAGDVVSSEIAFHELLITIPEPGGDLPLPRIRADGLSMMLRVGGVAQVEATALAVDNTIPSLYAPVGMGRGVTAQGFLASGRVDIVGLGAFGGALGVLELRKPGFSRAKHAMFVYGQAEKLTERIDTPIGPLFVREAGFGFGKNYTLTALAGADEAETPRELVKILDEISKIQGNLTNFNAWTPQFNKDALTFALRGMISMAATSKDSASYDADGEAKVSNPLLMDVVLALRTDLTFFVNVRGWLATNYHDWSVASSTADFKELPTLRGYLYFSVPREELLARFLSDPTGKIGKHPELPKELITAIESSRFASTLYIRPGLYHLEFGWPYELGFDIGKPTDNFYLSLSGGLVFRIEDATALYGIAFKASGVMQLGGRIGNARFGASAVAKADFLLRARFIAYVAPLDPKETLFYGEIFLGLTLDFAILIWMSFRIFRKRFTIKIGFSIGLTISVAAEVVLSGDGLGARVFAAVGVRGFGRTLTVPIGFSFGDSALDRARSRVARFMQLGLGVDAPSEETLLTPAPSSELARKKRAEDADTALDQSAPPKLPTSPPPDPDADESQVPGRKICGTDFWAVLFDAGKDEAGDDTYLVQLVPRDNSENNEGVRATFYVEPWPIPEPNDDDGNMEFAGVAKDRNTGDYEIDTTHLVPGLFYFGDIFQSEEDACSGEFKWRLLSSNKTKLCANLNKIIGKTEHGVLDLNLLLAECFLAHPDSPENKKGFGEPWPIFHELIEGEERSPREARHLQGSRLKNPNQVEAKLEASIIAEEKRSALINKIGESAFGIAEVARARSKLPKEIRLEGDPEELNAFDFGLTFLVKASDLVPPEKDPAAESEENTLFKKNGEANFTLTKRVSVYSEGSAEPTSEFVECGVELLNRPDQAFEKIQPRLDDARVERAEDGFRLLWDLEPAFGSSAKIADDPETRLAFYEIERSFEGAQTAMSATFRTKSATIQKFTFDVDRVTTQHSRATLHLVDDLSRGSVPEDLRALLFGVPISSGQNASEIWTTAFGNRSEISIVYKVTAVDVLGTRTGQRVLEKTIKRPPLEVKPPLKAELSVAFDNGLPQLGAIKAPRVNLALYFTDSDAVNQEKFREQILNSSFQLRVRAYQLKGGGQYGADAVDDSKSRPEQLDIDTKHDALDRDIYLSSDPNGVLTINFIFSRENSEETKIPRTFAVKENDAELTQTHEQQKTRLEHALRIPDNLSKVDDLRACRVFLRRRSKEDAEAFDGLSRWIYVETLLQASKSGARKDYPHERSGFTAVVELLETPLELPFQALEQQQIERQAGRLELLYPGEQATLCKLAGIEADCRAEGEEESDDAVTSRRLDPDRRSAIRLDFNASGARLGQGDETELATVIAGYDVFTVDPARLRILTGEGTLTGDVVAKEAQKRATVKVLPRSLAGTSPSALPDIRSVEVRYPSDTVRTDPSRLAGRIRAPWYSAAESLVVFPQRCLRRSLFPAPEEVLISELLDEHNVKEVLIELKNPDSTESFSAQDYESIIKPLRDSALNVINGFIDRDNFTPGVLNEQGEMKPAIYSPSDPSDLVSAGELRGLLRGLMIRPNDQVELEYRKWRREGSPEYRANAFRVLVHIVAKGENGEREAEVEVNLATAQHPALADVLDALTYEKLYSSCTNVGEVYRAYEVVREPTPPLESKGFNAFLDARAPSADPYGWATLRSLGLATGIRIYDIDNAQFLKGKALFEHVDTVFRETLQRYSDVSPLGLPFVELVDLPEDFMGISSFDGRAASDVVDDERLRNGDTSILQIGLRPHADRLVDSPTPPPVRYLACFVKQTEDSNKSLDSGELSFERREGNSLGDAVIDAIGLPLIEGAGTTRFATGDTWKTIFEETESFSDKAQVTYGRLAGHRPNSLAFLLRVTRLEENFDSENVFRLNLENQISDKGLCLSPWIDFPDTTNAATFDRFPALDRPLLQYLLKISDRAADTPFSGFTNWLPPRHHPANEDIFDTETVAARFGVWTERFLRHGSALTKPLATVQDVGPDISIAFAALTTEESYARTPDASGRVSAFLIDPSRIGRERYFAVRPFGRYTALETAVAADGERPVTLIGGLGNPPESWRKYFVAVSLPRSKPLEPPAILSAELMDENDEKRGAKGIELIVARTPDQIVSTANLRAERASQGGWTGLELRARYPAREIARAILNKGDFNPFDGFNEREFGGPEALIHEDMENVSSSHLVTLRNRVPDAWRGAIRYELAGLPPFFELTALVHQSAGVVVSDVAAVPLPATGAILRQPPVEQGEEDEISPPETCKSVRCHELADPPNWSFDYDEHTDDKKIDAVVRFDLPMVRNIDLMSDIDITAWTGDKPERVAPVYRLPDAATSYRISSVSPDFASVAPLIEILPAGTPKKDESLYLTSLLAKRFESVASEVTVERQNGNSEWNWRLGVTATLSSGDSQKVTVPDVEVDDNVDGAFKDDTVPGDFKADIWARWAPRRSFKFKIRTVDTDLIDALRGVLKPFENARGVDSILSVLETPEVGDEVKGWLPLGLKVPDVSGFADVLELGNFVFPEYRDGWTLQVVARRNLHWVADLAGDGPVKARSMIEALRKVARAKWATGKAGIGSVYVAFDDSDVSAHEPPYAHFRMVSYTKQDSSKLDESDITALIDAFESAKTQDEYVRIQAVGILEKLEKTAATISQAILPLPVDDALIEVNGLKVKNVESRIYAGVHWLPSVEELKQAPEELSQIVNRAIRTAILGDGAQLRLTAYRGDATAIKTRIKHKSIEEGEE